MIIVVAVGILVCSFRVAGGVLTDFQTAACNIGELAIALHLVVTYLPRKQ